MKTIKTFVIASFLLIFMSGGMKLQAQTMDYIPEEFSEYLPMFLETYHTNSPYIFLYLSTEIGFYTATNPGAYCFAEKQGADGFPWCTRTEEDAPCYQIDPAIPYDIFNTIPAGGFCEGYPGVASGYYYTKIAIEDLPSFTLGFNDDGESIYGGIGISEQLENAPLMKVTVIYNELHSCYLYFIKIENSWCFICQSFCDCSA